MLPGGTDRVRRGRAVRRRAVLELQQAAGRKLRVESRRSARRRQSRAIGRTKHQAAAVLAVVLDRLAEQEVLQEVHARTAQIGAQARLARAPTYWAGEAQRCRVAIRLGIRIRTRDGPSRGRLSSPWMNPAVSWSRLEPRERRFSACCAVRSRPHGVQLLLLESGCVAPAAVVGRMHRRGPRPAVLAMPDAASRRSPVAVAAAFEPERRAPEISPAEAG